MSRFQPQSCLVNQQHESSFPIQNPTKHIFGKCTTYAITEIQLISYPCFFEWAYSPELLIYAQQIDVLCGLSKLPLSSSSCQRQLILVRQKWDKVFQQISIVTVHRSEKEGALQCVFTRVSGSVTKDVFHAPSSFHLNLLLLDRFFYQRVSFKALFEKPKSKTKDKNPLLCMLWIHINRNYNVTLLNLCLLYLKLNYGRKWLLTHTA